MTCWTGSVVTKFLTWSAISPTAFLFLAACAPVHASASRVPSLCAAHNLGTPICVKTADLDCDRSPETVVITYRSRQDGRPMGGDIVVFQGERLLWRQSKLNPWKLEIADLDSDGRQEILVGVWKKSPKDPVMAKRVFIYNWNGKRLTPRWLSSRLSRRFTDFTVGKPKGKAGTLLFALEDCPGGLRRISAYGMISFGCEHLAATEARADLLSLKQDQKRPIVVSKTGMLDIVYHGKSLELRTRR